MKYFVIALAGSMLCISAQMQAAGDSDFLGTVKKHGQTALEYGQAGYEKAKETGLLEKAKAFLFGAPTPAEQKKKEEKKKEGNW
jgi:hypothetical protein